MVWRYPGFQKGRLYHIYNHGVEKRNIFECRQDYEYFVNKLLKYTKKYDAEVVAFCLLPNHYHMILKQQGERLSQVMHGVGLCHSMYFNKRYDRVGGLFQGSFNAKHLDTKKYLLDVSRFIHMGALDIGVAPEKYEWSSYAAYATQTKYPWIVCRPILQFFTETSDYLRFVQGNN